jgi:lipoprotein-anchoring transpeptidase ErfK/SrfK
MRRSAGPAVAVAAVATAALLWAGHGLGNRRPAPLSQGLASLPASPAPALKIGRPVPLGSDRHFSRWTIVRVPAVARAAPNSSAAVVTRLAVSAPEGTPNLLSVLATRTGRDGKLWVEARLPVLPNGTTGWVPRRSLGPYETVETHLVVDRARFRVTLYRRGRIVFAADAGVGTDASPTPAGEFAVRSELTRYASPFYGPVAFGTTARSAVLTDWPEGGFVGIHGTDEPQLIPGRVSHGCIRLRNSDILRLARLLPVGTPVTIR